MTRSSVPRSSLIGLLSLLPACGSDAFSEERRCPQADPVRLEAMAARPAGAASAPRTRNVILLTVDGVRWQEVFGGVDAARARRARMSPAEVVGAEELLPNLHRQLGRRGVVVGKPGGAEMVASGPSYLSLPGYREIFTGHPPTRCRTNHCGFITEATLLDELRLTDRLGREEIAVISSWRTIERAASREPGAITLSAGQPADGASAYPGHADYRPDRDTTAVALDYLVTAQPRLLFIGLGDSDEYAHRGDYRGYIAALRAADRFVGQLLATLALLGEYGAETTVIVTTDHGRSAAFTWHGAAAPESRRVWLFAAGGAVPVAARASRGVTRLADIAPTVRRLLGLPPDRSPGAGRPLAALLPASPVAAAPWGSDPLRGRTAAVAGARRAARPPTRW